MNLNSLRPDDLLIIHKLITELDTRLKPIGLLKLTRAVLRGFCAVIDAELVARQSPGYAVEIDFTIIYPGSEDEAAEAKADETQPLPAPPDMEHWDLQEREHFNERSTVQPVRKSDESTATAFADFVNSLDLDDLDEEL